MAATEALKRLVDQMPDPDNRQMYTENIDKAKIEGAIARIAEGGRASVEGLVELLDEPGTEADVKPHYALRALGNHFLIRKDEAGRRVFGAVLAAALSQDLSKNIKAFLCQELQWAGGSEAVAALGKLLMDEDLLEPAGMALQAIGDREQFRSALPRARGRTRLSLLQRLAELNDAKSAEAFRKALSDPDRETRLVGGWGLARLADVSAVDPLIRAADASKGWERIQATKHCLVLAENLAAKGRHNDATRIYTHLKSTRTDPSERHIRDAATRALAPGVG